MGLLNPLPLNPSQSATPRNRLSVVVSDDRIILSLVGELLARSGMSDAEIAERLGVKRQSISQYRYGRRTTPSVRWLARLAELTGARLLIEWPARGLK